MGMYYSKGLSIEDKKAETNVKLGQEVKSVRKKAGMTQQQLVNFLEIRGGKTLISQVEHGKRTLPANVLPLIAEQGDRTVESLFRDYKYDAGSVFSKCLYKMNVPEKEHEPILAYMDTMIDSAIDNTGALKMFDIMFSVIRAASDNGDKPEKISDEVIVCEKYDYDKFPASRFLNYIKEMSVYKK
jgi:transcriptional regulator with XRE-family HTH domain